MTDRDCLPNFFIVGFPKAGTSSLHSWLAAHPDAFGSLEKETCFFVDEESHVYRPGRNVRDSWASYREQFPIPKSRIPKVIFESTPTYAYQKTALDHIPDLPTEPKCLFIIREPADQIRSIYTYFRNNWTYIPAELTFAEFIAQVRSGNADFGGNELANHAIEFAHYERYLEQWRNRLDDVRFRICTFDDLRDDCRKLTMTVAEWIGLDPTFYLDYDFPNENESYVPRSRLLQRLNVAFRERLPQGRSYRVARRLYRRINSTRTTATDIDSEEMAALRREFRDANESLAKAFDLDLAKWTCPAVVPPQVLA